ncbi:MAG: hypothetical protein AAGN66_28045 [Acidobacteriota bacterium]
MNLRRIPWGDVVKAVAWAAAVFVPPILYLALHRGGWVERHNAIAYERTLILNLLVYWALASCLLLAWGHRSAVRGWLRLQAAPLLLMVFSIGISLVFVEVALRILRPQMARPFERLPSPTLHHVNAPDRSSYGMGGARVETNGDGFRTPYSRDGFLAKDHRVALLGDSYVFGLGVEGHEAVSAVLERELAAHLESQGGDPSSVAVLNTGVISYSPLLERAAFREVVSAYDPTVTLMLVDLNDIGDDHQYARENVSGDPARPRFDVPPAEGPSLCQRSVLCRGLGPVWSKLGRPFAVASKLLGWERRRYDYYAFEVEVAGKKETNRFFVLRYPLEQTRPYFDATFANVEATAGDVRASGSSFAFAALPRYFHWNDDEAPDNWEAHRYGVDEPYENEYLRYFEEAAGGAGFPVWSLIEEFRAHRGGPLVFRHDPHWNADGHALVGRALARRLIDAGWPDTTALDGPTLDGPNLDGLAPDPAASDPLDLDTSPNSALSLGGPATETADGGAPSP